MTDQGQERVTNLDLDNAYCDECGRSLFRLSRGPYPKVGHWSEWSPSELRAFITASRCAYEDCEGRPLVPAQPPREVRA